MLLGAAMLGACASGDVLSLQDAMKKLGGKAAVVHPHCKLVEYVLTYEFVFINVHCTWKYYCLIPFYLLYLQLSHQKV